MDVHTGSAPYYEPLHNELIDTFTAKVDVTSRATFSSSCGLMAHTAQSQPDVDDTIEDSGQEETGQQQTEERTTGAFMVSGQNKSKFTKKGYNENITQNDNVS